MTARHKARYWSPYLSAAGGSSAHVQLLLAAADAAAMRAARLPSRAADRTAGVSCGCRPTDAADRAALTLPLSRTNSCCRRERPRSFSKKLRSTIMLSLSAGARAAAAAAPPKSESVSTDACCGLCKANRAAWPEGLCWSQNIQAGVWPEVKHARSCSVHVIWRQAAPDADELNRRAHCGDPRRRACEQHQCRCRQYRQEQQGDPPWQTPI